MNRKPEISFSTIPDVFLLCSVDFRDGISFSSSPNINLHSRKRHNFYWWLFRISLFPEYFPLGWDFSSSLSLFLCFTLDFQNMRCRDLFWYLGFWEKKEREEGVLDGMGMNGERKERKRNLPQHMAEPHDSFLLYLPYL